MKLPDSFRLKQDLEEKTDGLLEGKIKIDEEKVGMLLDSCAVFLEKIDLTEPEQTQYEDLIKDMEYTKYELKELSRRITPETNLLYKKGKKEDVYPFLGFYLSLLTNKIIQEKDVIELIANMELSYVGSYLSKGKLKVYGNLGNYTGNKMGDGELTVYGNSGFYTAHHMRGGRLIVKGDVDDCAGSYMGGGELIVEGKIESIHPYCKGTIYQGKNKVWPK